MARSVDSLLAPVIRGLSGRLWNGKISSKLSCFWPDNNLIPASILSALREDPTLQQLLGRIPTRDPHGGHDAVGFGLL